MLLQWIRHHILVFEERKFPTSYEEIEVSGSRALSLRITAAMKPVKHLFIPSSDLQVLWRQFLKFKETELPAKEADKNRSKHIFKSFEVSFISSSNKSGICHELIKTKGPH